MRKYMEIMDQVLNCLEEVNEEKKILVAKSVDYKTQVDQLNKVEDKVVKEIPDLKKDSDKLCRNQKRTRKKGK